MWHSTAYLLIEVTQQRLTIYSCNQPMLLSKANSSKGAGQMKLQIRMSFTTTPARLNFSKDDVTVHATKGVSMWLFLILSKILGCCIDHYMVFCVQWKCVEWSGDIKGSNQSRSSCERW